MIHILSPNHLFIQMLIIRLRRTESKLIWAKYSEISETTLLYMNFHFYDPENIYIYSNKPSVRNISKLFVYITNKRSLYPKRVHVKALRARHGQNWKRAHKSQECHISEFFRESLRILFRRSEKKIVCKRVMGGNNAKKFTRETKSKTKNATRVSRRYSWKEFALSFGNPVVCSPWKCTTTHLRVYSRALSYMYIANMYVRENNFPQRPQPRPNFHIYNIMYVLCALGVRGWLLLASTLLETMRSRNSQIRNAVSISGIWKCTF